jgi:phage terminase large subunit-like protein
LLTRLETLSSEHAEALLYSWDFWARPDQRLPPGNWPGWLLLAGRGFGKTRTGAEAVRTWARDFRFVNIIAATADDARDIMVEGESGILAVCPRSERPFYRTSKSRLEWPNGSRTLIFTADEPERLRGKQHEKLWADEVAAWRYPESWDQGMMGLRLGKSPQVVVTTTPRPTALVRELIKAPGWIVTRGTTYDNRPNLADQFFAKVITKYEGTRLGRQELNAELLDDNPRALWQRDNIDRHRVAVAPSLSRVVVGLDPNVKNRDRVELAKSSDILDEAGIVAAGVSYVDGKLHGYILGDYSLDEGPNLWGMAAVKAYRDHKADRIIGEVNNGGDMVEATIRAVDMNASYKSVTASRGKAIRAEPIAALYEQGRIHHVGSFPQLEDEMCDFDPITTTKSPNRMDALVWAFTELFEDDSTGMLEFMRGQASVVAPVAPAYPTPTTVTGWPG